MIHLECENASVVLETSAPPNSTSKSSTMNVIIKNRRGMILFNMIIGQDGSTTVNVNTEGWENGN